MVHLTGGGMIDFTRAAVSSGLAEYFDTKLAVYDFTAHILHLLFCFWLKGRCSLRSYRKEKPGSRNTGFNFRSLLAFIKFGVMCEGARDTQ